MRLLRVIETAFPSVDVLVPRQRDHGCRARAGTSRSSSSLVAEMLAVLRTGQALTPDAVERSIAMLRGEGGSPSSRADRQHPVQPRPHDPSQDAEPEALRGCHRRPHHRLRHRPGRYGQDLPGRGQGRAGAAEQADQPHHPDPAGGGGGREPGLPAGHAEREDRPLPAAALRRAARHDRPRVDPASDDQRHHRGRPAGLHARPDAQRRVRHPRRGAEHLRRTDEDVPDPAGVRLDDGGHRRRDPDRPARRHAQRTATWCGRS